MNARVIASLVALIALGASTACSTGSNSPGMGTVSVYLTDAPIDLTEVHAVNVTVSGIVLYASDSGDDNGVALDNGPIALGGDLTINLLDFQSGATTFLGSAAVVPGSYKRIRLEIVSAELLMDDDHDPATPDVTIPITVPSHKVDVPVPFQLIQNENLMITLDFNAQASVQVNASNGQAGYLLRPVINVASARPAGV